ncbi:MAG: VWA domain-containing protein, partial [Elusimicrobia bacterium]|nr:VWA domain-containing protein [Elusimicrobiota bacterium]
MIFSRPWSFLFLLAGPLLAALFISAFRSKARLLKTMGDPAVLKKLMDPLAPRRQKVKAVLLVLSAILFALALAGPRWGQRFQDLRRRGIDVVIAVDVSASMLAEDLPPNRLTQAKRELGLLINRLEGDRVGLVAFAGTAFLQCPLTLDYGAVRSLLELIDTDLIPTPGTNLAAAIHTACDAFRRNEKKHKALVLLTDGEDHSGRFEDALRRAAGEGVRVFAIGFGNPDGEVIPLRDAQGTVSAYRKDKTGQTVVSKLNETDLRSAAAKTGGLYFRASQGEIEVDRVAESLRQMEKKHLESRVFDQYE